MKNILEFEDFLFEDRRRNMFEEKVFWIVHDNAVLDDGVESGDVHYGKSTYRKFEVTVLSIHLMVDRVEKIVNLLSDEFGKNQVDLNSSKGYTAFIVKYR